ncbi:hypothetical protein CDAR_16521 [Caerostris darwini]|uniref:Uncharacterized protein n=1 Tax=Caerostris darwini TaxID=1538125 RepID=A0AAV4P7L0_9ARAC|nr:hypothetical protein CDAR_16521 [Caerostris darwini]
MKYGAPERSFYKLSQSFMWEPVLDSLCAFGDRLLQNTVGIYHLGKESKDNMIGSLCIQERVEKIHFGIRMLLGSTLQSTVGSITLVHYMLLGSTLQNTVGSITLQATINSFFKPQSPSIQNLIPTLQCKSGMHNPTKSLLEKPFTPRTTCLLKMKDHHLRAPNPSTWPGKSLYCPGSKRRRNNI